MPLTKPGSEPEEQPSSVRRSTQIRYAVLGALAFIVRFAAFGSFFPYIFLWLEENGFAASTCGPHSCLIRQQFSSGCSLHGLGPPHGLAGILKRYPCPSPGRGTLHPAWLVFACAFFPTVVVTKPSQAKPNF